MVTGICHLFTVYMGLGVLESKYEFVPGTTFLDEKFTGQAEAAQGVEHLKRGVGRYRHVILVPQPSGVARDPLNWSSLRKYSILIILTCGAALGASLGPMLSPGTVACEPTMF